MILDANILIRAVLGSRVLSLLFTYGAQAEFYAPATAFEEAREYLPVILEKKGVDAVAALAVLDSLGTIVQVVDPESYSPFGSVARQRLLRRDEED